MPDDSQLDKLGVRLLELQQELAELKQSTDDAAGIVELDQSRVGRLSRMDALQGQAMAQESARRRDQQLVAIEQALQRISSGDYGYCLECGEEIAIERLMLNPTVTLCIDCANANDRS